MFSSGMTVFDFLTSSTRCLPVARNIRSAGISGWTFKIVFDQAQDLIKCSHCGSERLDEIGDVLECIDCKAVKALN